MTVAINTSVAGGGTGGGGAWGGITGTLSAQTDLQSALNLKADALAGATLGAGTTALTRAAHLNRPNVVNQAGNTTGTFAVRATSGALADDSFQVLNEGAGTFFAAGSITAGKGMKLWAEPGQLFTAEYDFNNDIFKSTTASGMNLQAPPLAGIGVSFGNNQYLSYGVANPNPVDTCVFGTPLTTDGSFGFWTRVRQNANIAGANKGTGINSPPGATTYLRLDNTGDPNGRFPLRIPFAIGNTTIAATCRVFVGLTSSVGAADFNADPSTRVGIDSFFVGADVADANLQVMWNDNAGTCTKVNLGASFPKSINIPYVCVFDRTTAGVPYVTVWNRSNDVILTTFMNDANAPRTTISYGFQVLVGSGSEVTAITACDIGTINIGGAPI